MSDSETDRPTGAAPSSSSEPGALGNDGGSASKPVLRAVRRTGTATGSAVRRASAGGAAGEPKLPAKPDTAKTVAIVVCGLLLLGCIATGVYLIFIKKGPPAKVAKLDDSAQRLADQAAEAAVLYKIGSEKAKGTTLADLTDAAEKLDKARALFNDVASKYLTVPGHEDDIKLAQSKKDSIDAELRTVNTRKNELEMQELHRPKTSSTDSAASFKPAPTTPPATPAPATPAGKEPTEEELSDKNLDRLFNDDPSEYERLAKIRAKKDPNFKMKQP